MMSDSTPRTLSCVGGTAVRAEEALAHGVQRARADVAVDDAERGERERKQATATPYADRTVSSATGRCRTSSADGVS